MPGGGVYYMARFSLLYVKIDPIAILREALGENEPDLVACALMCEKSGCDGITLHLREDRRYIHDKDVLALKESIPGKFNLEIPLSDELIGVAKKVRPNQITVVPENVEERTTGRGLDVRGNMTKIMDTVKIFHDQDIMVSLCVEPNPEAIELSRECEADFIEIHTCKYCSALDKTETDKEIDRIYSAADHAVKIGIKVSAGQGLNYKNILPVLKARALEQVTIGHSIISRSVIVGLSQAVKEMLEIME